MTESLATAVDEDIEAYKSSDVAHPAPDNNFFNKYISLKKYLKNNENKFIELEQKHLKSIKQIYQLLNKEQKMRLIRKPLTSKRHFLESFFFLD